MAILLVVVALVVITAVSLVMVGDRGRMPEVLPDREPSELPTDRGLLGADIDRVRFATGLRGYRMDQVDGVLDRVAADLGARTQYVTHLQEALAAAGLPVPPEPEPEPAVAPSADAEDPAEDPVEDADDHQHSGDAAEVDPDASR